MTSKQSEGVPDDECAYRLEIEGPESPSNQSVISATWNSVSSGGTVFDGFLLAASSEVAWTIHLDATQCLFPSWIQLGIVAGIWICLHGALHKLFVGQHARTTSAQLESQQWSQTQRSVPYCELSRDYGCLGGTMAQANIHRRRLFCFARIVDGTDHCDGIQLLHFGR